jgi:peptidoglycan hydrolase CwlO-like protein
MNEMQFLGYLVSALITVGGFVGVIIKFIQPINELRVVIQKLNDNIDALKNDNTQQNRRIEKHGEQIEDLEHRVGKVETKIEMYHKE